MFTYPHSHNKSKNKLPNRVSSPMIDKSKRLQTATTSCAISVVSLCFCYKNNSLFVLYTHLAFLSDSCGNRPYVFAIKPSIRCLFLIEDFIESDMFSASFHLRNWWEWVFCFFQYQYPQVIQPYRHPLLSNVDTN